MDSCTYLYYMIYGCFCLHCCPYSCYAKNKGFIKYIDEEYTKQEKSIELDNTKEIKTEKHVDDFDSNTSCSISSNEK